MVGTVFTERTNIDDIIRYELEDSYCRDAVTVFNRTGSTISAADVMGQPLRPDSSVAGAYRFLMSTEESYCNGLCLHRGSFAQSTLATATSFKTKALVRGPAIIDQNMLPAKDVLGVNSFTIATLVTALAALNPSIKSGSEPSVIVTQTY